MSNPSIEDTSMYEYYNEPNKFEQHIDELKSVLLGSVKKEHQEEMERLRKENAELQALKKRLSEIEQVRHREITELESVKRNALNEAKKMRLTELLNDYKAVIYAVDSIAVHKPKCTLCDNERRVPYLTPLGKKAKEDCTCKEYSYRYEIREITASSIEHYTAEDGIKINYYDNDREERVSAYNMYRRGLDFEKITSWTYFADKNDAQSYCDWATEKETQKHQVG
jgi:hypothetical protein